MFKRILVAVDDSKPSGSALTVAARLASELKGELAVVHVIDDSRAFRPELAFVDEELMRQLRRDGATIVEEACRQVPPGVNREPILIEGDPGDALVATARRWRADLIVIGSDSRGRLAHFLLGSTADSVIRRAPCPVVAVRADEAQSAMDIRGPIAAQA
jgi:nucleotide-binding universal stress UspA family protein